MVNLNHPTHHRRLPMKLEEAIKAVRNNWPDERYTMLREALGLLITNAEQAPAMLEALIKLTKWAEQFFEPSREMEISVKVIESATGKTWEELMEIPQ
jgi:hypothetical protein